MKRAANGCRERESKNRVSPSTGYGSRWSFNHWKLPASDTGPTSATRSTISPVLHLSTSNLSEQVSKNCCTNMNRRPSLLRVKDWVICRCYSWVQPTVCKMTFFWIFWFVTGSCCAMRWVSPDNRRSRQLAHCGSGHSHATSVQAKNSTNNSGSRFSTIFVRCSTMSAFRSTWGRTSSKKCLKCICILYFFGFCARQHMSGDNTSLVKPWVTQWNCQQRCLPCSRQSKTSFNILSIAFTLWHSEIHTDESILWNVLHISI